LPLSLVRSQWLPWHDRDPYEENNSEVDAYGPLESLDVYGSAIWDETDPTDFYYFEPSTPGLATATLDGMASGIDLDLAVWVYSELSQSYQLVDWGGEYGNTPEVVSFPVQAGRRYWIEIRPYAIRESTHPNWQPNAYTVQVIYN